ncbi:aminotransferase class III-fold pyridoxal phosphate-dependent enzyme [Neobacillus pocheonensis]|nr:aminotransferase class III-fold pyridoxal phosphate-dependent enzyme [Neobacillus pocheonensis]
MMIGIEFDQQSSASLVPKIKSKALENGLLIMNCGVSGQTIRLMLPLNIQEDVLDKGLTILEDAISETIAGS